MSSSLARWTVGANFLRRETTLTFNLFEELFFQVHPSFTSYYTLSDPNPADFNKIIQFLRHCQRFIPSYRDIQIDSSPSARDFVEGLPDHLLNRAQVSTSDIAAAVNDVADAAHVGTDHGDLEGTHVQLQAVLLEPTGAPEETEREAIVGALSLASRSARSLHAGAEMPFEPSEDAVLHRPQDPPAPLSTSFAPSVPDRPPPVPSPPPPSGHPPLPPPPGPRAPPVQVRHDATLVNEFTDMQFIMEGASRTSSSSAIP